jgi:transposase
MPKTARTFSPEEKATVALAAIKGEKTFAQIGAEYQVHPTQIGLWRKQALDNFASLFADNKKKEKHKENRTAGSIG